RQRACLAATGSWTACSRRIIRAELRRLKTTPLMGPAPRRSALREDRRLARAETIARIFRTNFAAHSRAARAWFHIEIFILLLFQLVNWHEPWGCRRPTPTV